MELGDSASYLTEPPDSAQAMPPVPSTSLQLLPMASLTPPNLERLCLRLGEKEGAVEYAGIYGVPGQAQGGIDVLVRPPDGKYLVIQSRRTREVTSTGLRDAVTDFLDGGWAAKASSFIYATSASWRAKTVRCTTPGAASTLTRSGHARPAARNSPRSVWTSGIAAAGVVSTGIWLGSGPAPDGLTQAKRI